MLNKKAASTVKTSVPASWAATQMLRTESGDRYLLESESTPEGEIVPCAICGDEVNRGLRLTLLKSDGVWIDRVTKQRPVPIFCTLQCASKGVQHWADQHIAST